MLTDEQLAIRRTGITATDMAALFGASPWKTAFQVWSEKMGAVLKASGDDIERGEFLEDGARRWYAHRTGAKVDQPGTIRHPARPLVLATPDGIATLSAERRVLEIKMPRSGRGWGEPGTDDIPQHYLFQTATQIAVTAHMGVAGADVFAVLDGTPTLYYVRRDMDLEEMLCEAAERFWVDHVLPRRPPPVTEPATDVAALKALYPTHSPEARTWDSFSQHDRGVLAAWLMAKRAATASQEALLTWEAKAREVLGAAPQLLEVPAELGVERVDFRQSKDTARTDWAGISKVTEAYVGPVGYKRLLRQYTTTQQGARPLVVRWRRSNGG